MVRTNFQHGPKHTTMCCHSQRSSFMKTKILIFLCLGNLAIYFTGKAEEITQTNSNAAFIKEFVWSAPTNNLSLGITYLNPTNHFGEKSGVLVYLLDVGPTNTTWWRWMGPPQFKRVEYYLYDSSQKVVPYSATYHTSNKFYKTVSEIPQNVHNVRVGHVILSREVPVPYDQITLTNIFQIEHGGDYKLVVKGRIMKINDDSSLSVVRFPPVSLTIHLGDEDVPKKPN